MLSFLAWIDHDSKARERTLRILSLFQEKESRDEFGLGSVRDSFADQCNRKIGAVVVIFFRFSKCVATTNARPRKSKWPFRKSA